MGLLDTNLIDNDFCTFGSFFELVDVSYCDKYELLGLSSSGWRRANSKAHNLTNDILKECPIITDHHGRPRLDKTYLMDKFYGMLPDIEKQSIPNGITFEWSISRNRKKLFYVLQASHPILIGGYYNTRQLMSIELKILDFSENN